MTHLDKYKKRILKQYGKHIKAHEDRMDKQQAIELQISHFVKRASRWYNSFEDLKVNI